MSTTSIDSEFDFDLSDIIKRAINIAKQKQSVSIKPCNIKDPCGICFKSVNKNQKAIKCNTCLKWIHRKCNGISVQEYEALVNEPDEIPWLCILCNIDDMASKFPFGYLSKIELNGCMVLIYLHNLNYSHHLRSDPNYLKFLILSTMILIEILFNQLIQNIWIN